MFYFVWLAVAAALLIGLIWAEKTEDSKKKLAFKTPLSCMFAATALMQPQPLPSYFYLIFIGLILGLAGDVLLAIPGQTSFRAGLFSFLGGHVLYVIAFVGLASADSWLSFMQIFFLAVSFGIFLEFRPHLGDMMGPVIAYIVVITAMVMSAWAAFEGGVLPTAGSWFILVGAVLFYLSDLFVARDRFMAPGQINRVLGLPLYYGGQFIIAFSVGMVG